MSQDLRKALEDWMDVKGIDGIKGVQEMLALLWPVIESLQEIEMRTHFDEAEGPELRAQNAANYRAASNALQELREKLSREAK